MLDHLFLDKPWFLSAWAVLSVFFWWYLPKGCEQDFCGDADRRVAQVIVAVLGGGILTALVIPVFYLGIAANVIFLVALGAETIRDYLDPSRKWEVVP